VRTAGVANEFAGRGKILGLDLCLGSAKVAALFVFAEIFLYSPLMINAAWGMGMGDGRRKKRVQRWSVSVNYILCDGVVYSIYMGVACGVFDSSECLSVEVRARCLWLWHASEQLRGVARGRWRALCNRHRAQANKQERGDSVCVCDSEGEKKKNEIKKETAKQAAAACILKRRQGASVRALTNSNPNKILPIT
jgi:hypothetical protein